MPRRVTHQGRVSAPIDIDAPRPRKRSITVTAWIIVVGLVLAAFAPLVVILLGS